MTFPFRALIWVPFCLLHGALPAQPETTIELDLETAFERAPQANFQILLSEQQVQSQESSTRISRSALLPQLSADITQGRSMSPTVDAFSQAFPGIPKRFFNNRFDALIRGRLALLNVRSLDDWKLSRLDLQAARLGVDNLVQEILQQIAVAYFFHWRNQRRLDVIDANLERDRLLLRIAEDQRDAGVATNLDVTRAEVRLANNELARLQQETAVMESELNLKRILNYPLESTLVLKVEQRDWERGYTQWTDDRFARVLEQRSDYQQLQAELQRAEFALKASQRERLPSLTLSGEWGYAAETWSDDMFEQWAVQLGLSMPLFEGFRLTAQEQVAVSTLRQKELELADLRQQIESQYRLTLQNLDSRARQVEVSRRSRNLNEREFELARIRFEEGVADNSDVVDAQAALADAEDQVVEAEFQYIQALINRARIEGDVRQFQDSTAQY